MLFISYFIRKISLNGINLPNIVWQFCFGCTFYAIGNAFKKYQYQLGMTTMCVLLAIYLFNPYYLHFHVDFRIYGKLNYSDAEFLYWIPFSIAGIILINNFAKHIARWSGISWINRIGRDSMTYLCLHIPATYLIQLFLTKFFDIENGTHEQSCLVVCILIAVLPTLNYLLKKQHFIQV